MRAQTFHFFVLIVSILLNCHKISAQQFTTDGTHKQLDSSEGNDETTPEFGNEVVKELQRDYRKGFEEIVSFFHSINDTIGKMNSRMDNFEKIVNTLNSTLNQRNQELFLHPRATVYSGENYTGESEDIENVTSDCVDRKCGILRKLSGRVKSIQTFGTCVRLFQSKYSLLGGWSLAVYPGSTIPADVLTSNLEGVKGIGPCLPDEFDGATIGYLTQPIKKNHSDVRTTVPDLVEFFSETKAKKGISMNTRWSYDEYLLGPFNRVEYLQKTVYKNYLNPTPKPTSAMERTAFYRSLNKLPRDVVCFGIPVALGGQASETFNIFPQTPQGAEEWLRITSDIPSFINNSSDLWVIISLNFMYESNNSTRPYAFYYFLNYGSRRISYSRVRN